MPVKKLDHFLVRAADLAATKAFYETVLGLRDGDRPSFPFPGHWLYLGDSPCVHLVGTSADAAQSAYLDDGGRAEVNVGSGAVDHIGFWATDLDGMLERLEDLSVPARRREVPGLVQLFVEDPNGITIELNFPDS
ncbi:MAG: VOC family protein [Proteobacteria bacterium]|nr:VOC family protein [Pseudomonadota bacterium]